MAFQDVAPRAAPDERRPHAGGLRRLKVVIQPVTHVDDLFRRARGRVQQGAEERRTRLAGLPVIRRGDHVRRQVQAPQDAPGPGRLVPGHPDPHAHGAQLLHGQPRVRVQVAFPEILGLPRFRAPRPFLVQAETGPEEIKHFPVIPALRDNRAEYRRERMPGNAEPVGPRPVFTRFVNQRLTDIKSHSLNHAGILQYVRPLSASVSCLSHLATATIQSVRRCPLTGKDCLMSDGTARAPGWLLAA
jgi:hypothetical protein